MSHNYRLILNVLSDKSKYFQEVLVTLPVYFLCNFLFFFLFRLYNRVWKYAGHREALSVVLANVFGTGMFVMVMSISGINVPRSIYFLTFFLATAGVLVNRGILHHVLNMPDNQEISVTKLRVLLVGAGDAGNLILEDLAHSKNRTVVGFKIGRAHV